LYGARTGGDGIGGGGGPPGHAPQAPQPSQPTPPAPGPPRHDTADTAPGAGAVRFGDLLAGTALRTWAHDLLGRLTRDGRDLRGTLRAWIAAGGNAERAAQDLGVHAQTVREHVRSAEPVLERQLLAAGADLYEVVLALLATGDLAEPALQGT
ncbi:helix-turn-helix domain-containing protein, partial [Streptomyces sp. NPDC058964]|uniref:helix-turn-helix domain-containing protein n=1 Tax=Streptomyces sp. NPDC058964 TaxID=3346681 RepID=UPI0036827206